MASAESADAMRRSCSRGGYRSVADGQGRGLEIDRIGAGHDGEFAGLDHVLHLLVPIGEGLLGQGKFHGGRRARLQRDTTECLELFHRARDRAGDVAHVQLHDFVTLHREPVLRTSTDTFTLPSAPMRALDSFGSPSSNFV